MNDIDNDIIRISEELDVPLKSFICLATTEYAIINEIRKSVIRITAR